MRTLLKVVETIELPINRRPTFSCCKFRGRKENLRGCHSGGIQAVDAHCLHGNCFPSPAAGPSNNHRSPQPSRPLPPRSTRPLFGLPQHTTRQPAEPTEESTGAFSNICQRRRSFLSRVASGVQGKPRFERRTRDSRHALGSIGNNAYTHART